MDNLNCRNYLTKRFRQLQTTPTTQKTKQTIDFPARASEYFRKPKSDHHSNNQSDGTTAGNNPERHKPLAPEYVMKLPKPSII